MVILHVKYNKPTRMLQIISKLSTSVYFAVELPPFRIVKWSITEDIVNVSNHEREAFADLGLLKDTRRVNTYTRITYRLVVGEDSFLMRLQDAVIVAARQQHRLAGRVRM
jgi:hypothetical protein